MMNMTKIYLLIIIVFTAQFAACAAGPEVRPDEGIPDVEPPEEALLEDIDVPQTLEGEYEFTMAAIVDGLANLMVFDTMETDWKGKFVIDSNGQIKGQGSFTYKAEIYSVDDNKCGYVWDESGEFEFSFGGTVRLDGDIIPIKILSPKLKSSNTGGPNATCSDPGKWRLEQPSNYISSHRDSLISAIIQHIHTKLGNQLKDGEPLETKVGTVNYGILVKYSPSLAPLVPGN